MVSYKLVTRRQESGFAATLLFQFELAPIFLSCRLCDAYMALLVSPEEACNGERTKLTAAMARMFAVKAAASALLRTPRPGNPTPTAGLVFKR